MLIFNMICVVVDVSVTMDGIHHTGLIINQYIQIIIHVITQQPSCMQVEYIHNVDELNMYCLITLLIITTYTVNYACITTTTTT